MNKFFTARAVLILSLLTLVSSGCYSTHHLISQTYNYDNGVTMTIDKMQEGAGIQTGNGHYYSGVGSKFVFLFVSLKNNSNETKKLDLTNIYLLEPKSHTKNKVSLVLMQSVVNLFGGADPTLQKNTVMKRKLVIPFPKNEQPVMIEVNGTISDIRYSEKAN